MIALGLGRETGAALPVAALASQLESGLVAQGHGDEDMSGRRPNDPRRSRASTASDRRSLRSSSCRAPRRSSSSGSPSRSVVARPEALRVVHPRDVDPRAAGRTDRAASTWAYLPSRIADHPAGHAVGDQVHRHVRERDRDHRVERVGLAAAQVVGQLATTTASMPVRRLSSRPAPRRRSPCGGGRRRRARRRPRVVRALPDRALGGDHERVVARVGAVVLGEHRRQARRGRTGTSGMRQRPDVT